MGCPMMSQYKWVNDLTILLMVSLFLGAHQHCSSYAGRQDRPLPQLVLEWKNLSEEAPVMDDPQPPG